MNVGEHSRLTGAVLQLGLDLQFGTHTEESEVQEHDDVLQYFHHPGFAQSGTTT
jgi:hypothetical protein